MKKKLILCAAMVLPLLSWAQTATNLADYVNTSIGVVDKRYSNCVVGPRMPYSSISPSPQTPKGNMDGYHPQQPIMGFGQLHVSGTGWSSYGHFLVSPQTGSIDTRPDGHLSAHHDDVTRAYYYRTTLDRYGISAEIAPTHYAAIYRFDYGKASEGHLLFDAAQAIASDIEPTMHGRVIATETTIDESRREIRMHLRYKGGWINGNYDVYCVVRCQQPFAACGVWRGDSLMPASRSITTAQGDTLHSGAYCTFRTQPFTPVVMKLAVSMISADRAALLLSDDIPGWDFEAVKQRGCEIWSDKLSTMRINTRNEDIKTIFYSSLFRVFTAVSDRRLDNPHSTDTTRPYWDDNYAFWDTFRTLYPLYMLVDAPVVSGNINTAIDILKRDGEVYDGFICGRSRLAEQGGNDIDHVIAEACLKDLPGVDWQEAYAIVKQHADRGRLGYKGTLADTDGYRQVGFIPERSMSCSQTLEYAYNDYSAALMARKLGHKADYKQYLKRSASWQHLWNPQLQDRGYSGFIDARRLDGSFAFFPASKYGGSWAKPFYEASSWTYSYYVPHDFATLIRLMGGNAKFVERLEYGFRNNLVKNDNEPGFLATFAFTHAGRPDLSSYWARQVMRKGFDLTGYPGNEDTGSMGSWYAFCALGFFPNAGQDYYYLLAPSVEESVLTLSNGKTLTIRANASQENVYIESCTLNGKKIKTPIILHRQLAQGGVLEFRLSNIPTIWGR